MSWNPFPGFHGAAIDKHQRSARKHRDAVAELLPTCNPPKFEVMNKLSKHFYLWWLNEMRQSNPRARTEELRGFDMICPPYYLNIFKRYPDLIYKPLLKHLDNY